MTQSTTNKAESRMDEQIFTTKDGRSVVPGLDDSYRADQGDEQFAHVDVKKTLRRLDIRILPMMAILYLFSFLDRGNIGNAKVLGLSEDLHLNGSKYNLALTVFFFPYIVFEVPSNLILKKLRPSIWLPTIMIAWGIVTTCTGTVQTYHGLLIARIFLGVTEAGLYPGVAFYLTTFYAPADLAFRQGLFFSAASIAGAFSGLLAYGISHMDGVGGYAGWRWIFILEGLATIVLGALSFFLIHDSPQTARFLSAHERAWIAHRLSPHPTTDAFRWKFVLQALTSWQVWLGMFVNIGNSDVIYGMAYFLPTIVKKLGYTGQSANLLTIPVYVVASINVVVMCYLSDRMRKRSTFILGLMTVEILGFVMALVASIEGGVPGLVYAGVFLATGCCYAAFVLNVVSLTSLEECSICADTTWTWVIGNLAPEYKRAAGTAMLIGLGNISGPMGSNFYRTQDAPKFVLGHSLEIGFLVLGVVAVLTMRFTYKRLNTKREEQMERWGVERKAEQDMADEGDGGVAWRYLL